MARYRLSGPARSDLIDILAASLERWGAMGRSRYATLLAAAMRAAARDPQGPTTRDRSDLLPGARSLHMHHAVTERAVKEPVHVLYYRQAPGGVIEILRVLHERMDPERHLEPVPRRR